MGDYLPRKDMEFQSWLSNFLTVAEERIESLGIEKEELQTLSQSRQSLQEALESVETTRAAYLMATENKERARNVANSVARSVVRRVQANPRVTSEIKSDLRITVREVRTPQPPPVPPTRLVAVGFDNGQHDLRWQRGSNSLTTHYVIEAKIGSEDHWTKVDVVTATKYRHTGQTPGVKIVYRILARRSSKLSAPSNEFTLYADMY